ncbi:ARM repeat-containing protein [Lactarius sanguifluus]|nr:ARM repeat-containing protein [Lactarius sanguifluus]
MSATSEWVTPPTRPELIESLVSGVDRYNPSNVGILEDYLYHQIRSREYDCLANLAILKLYQFNPDLYNPDVVVNILVKALASVPFPDFNLSVALLDDRASNANMEEPDPLPGLLPFLNNLHSLLQQCRFPAFWALYHSDALEEVALRAVRATFQKIGSKRLGSYLDLEGSDLDEYVARLGWRSDTSTGVIEVPQNPDNQIASTVVQEDIKLPRKICSLFNDGFAHPVDIELTKVISHAISAV